jgi:hypothetical protein
MSIIKQINYMNMTDAEKLVGCRWTEFEFTQMAENGSYVYVGLDDYDMEEIAESIAWEKGKWGISLDGDLADCDNAYLKRLVNQEKLMKILYYDYGVRDGILVHVAW